jgi:hypothetical protein
MKLVLCLSHTLDCLAWSSSHHVFLTKQPYRSQINLSSRPGNVRTPVVRSHGIFLVYIDFKELVVHGAFVVLEAEIK